MQSNRQHKGVLASMSVGRPEHVLAAVDHGGVLTLLGNHSVATRIFVAPIADAAVSDASQPHALRYTLMSVTREVQTELARGPMPEMEAMRHRLSRDMLANMRRGRGYRRILLMTVCGLVGMVLGAAVVLGTQPVAVGGMPPMMPGPMTAPQQPHPAPAPQAPAPRTGSAMPDPASFLGDVSTPSSPVSLDDPDAPPQASLPSVQVPAAARLAPSASAPAPVAPNVPAAPPLPLPAPSAVAPSIPTAPAPMAPRADASPVTMPQMAAAPAPQPIITQVDADKARLELTALKDAQDALRTGRHLSPETLAALPPDIAQRFSRVAQAAPAASAAPVTPAPISAPVPSHDQYGIPTMPDKSSWAALGAVDVPLPGGGDIKTPGDMAKFGVR